ncbi:TrkH family potassium uptake protein [Allorhodopirellula solitaria]|uniref:TrkH family potassium uptake protein n=1 Tax=Allorhodopirellula solitaria TaxID=2527987 RepID=UPI001C9755DD|nr:TrkH family potassium uptake protein [Allorhodopirellula solitaria]
MALIVAGTLALKFIPGLYENEGLGWTDAVFTSTSAVCVTGLIVVDTATYFTPLGQAVVLVLIQLGGLGMLVLTSVIIGALGGRPSLRTESLAVGARHLLPQVPTKRLIVDVVRFTFLFEAIGAFTLYLFWTPRMGWKEAIWPSIFHSVSAFCNAGFSTNSGSLIEYQDSPATIVVISVLIVAGGLGFITMEEIHQRYIRRNPAFRRLSIHSKLVLATTAFLLLSGWALFALFEWQGLLSKMPLVDKLTNSLFMSVTPRTAGFNTIDYGSATDSTNFLTIILMMIGGSPGSTAGGMKTTTFALLGLLAWSRLRSHQTASFANRSIPSETIQRASGLFVIATGIVVLGVFVLAFIGDSHRATQAFLVRLFETTSAFNTVGLSMGITPQLSTPSRWIVIVLMFIGRTGPLSIAAALIVRLSTRGRFRLAYEDVVVG